MNTVILTVMLTLGSINDKVNEDYAHEVCDDEIYWENRELLKTDLSECQ